MASTDNIDLQQSNRQNANFNFNLYAFHAFVCVLLFLKYGQLLKFAQAIVANGLLIIHHLQQLIIINNRLYQFTRATTTLTLLTIFLSTCGIAIASNAVNGVTSSSSSSLSLSAASSQSAASASATSTALDRTALFYENDVNNDFATVQLKAIEVDNTDSEQTEKFLVASTLTEPESESSVNSSSALLSAAAAAAFTVGIFDGAFITPATNTIITDQHQNTNTYTNTNSKASSNANANTSPNAKTNPTSNSNTNNSKFISSISIPRLPAPASASAPAERAAAPEQPAPVPAPALQTPQHHNSSSSSSSKQHSFTFHLNSSTVGLAGEVVASSSTIFDAYDATLFRANNTTALEATTEVGGGIGVGGGGGGGSGGGLSTSGGSSTGNGGNDDEFRLPSIQAILVSIVLSFVILGTVVGNVLVCIAVCMVRKLRRPCNYLLVSLALSDLCVAVLVMPMALLYEVLEKWNFGPLLCDIWVSFDVLCCTASILNLCAISVDRYLAITKPLEYGVKRTPRRMTLCVALVWLAAACISLPPLLILGNEHVDEQGQPACAVCQNFAYQIYATLGSFYIPLAVMLFVYYQIFRAAHRIVLEEKRAQTHLQHALNGTQPQTSTQVPADSGGSGCGGGGKSSGGGGGGSGGGNGQQQQLQHQHRHSSYGNTSLSYSACGVLNATNEGSGSCNAAGVSGSSNLLGSPHQKKIRFQLAKEKKASTTLGIIMSAFTICWLPFFILALIRPFVESESNHVPQSLSSLFLWLGYANSLLNPIIYATLNRDFRKPFQAILYFRCSSLNTMMRENYYQDQYGEPPSQRVMLGDERHGARESFL